MQVSPNHPSLAGHFPGHPVVPAVVLLDCVRTALAAHLRRAATIVTLPAVKFCAPVPPGEEFEVRFTDGPGGRMNFEIRVAEKPCVTGTLTHK
jgi:3-hydroxymyristoyl/3-hydroxydecanoyl-(acyl carrier protein) dehydratase